MERASRAESEVCGRDFHLVPIEYLEYMCATGDPSAFRNALISLRVSEGWLQWDSDPSGDWHGAMPNPLPANPIIETAAGEFLWMDKNRQDLSRIGC